MSHQIPEDAQRLADRLRMAAEEIESAARYGVPIPYMVSVSGHQYGGASFNARGDEFDAWVTYTETEAEDYEHRGGRWSRAEAIVNGLRLEFGVRREAAEVSA